MATIIGTNSNNTLNGTASSDTIIGRAGNDQLFGNGGNDRLNGGIGNDTLNGGTGIDTADYSNLVIGGTTYPGATAGVTVNLNLTGAQNTGGAGIDQLVSMENLIGTNFNDVLTGNSVNNLLLGLGNNDTLNGGSGNDVLAGGLGNDTLNGGSGIDTADYGNIIIGGTTFIGASSGVTVNLNLAGAQNTGGAGIDQLVSIENLNGTSFNNDTLTGNSGNNLLMGLGGHDTLNGGAGNDTLNGGAGDDRLNGGTGIDTASYTTATAGVRVGLGIDTDGQAQNTGGAGTDTLLNIENLTGSNFNDSLSAVFPLTDNGTLSGGAGIDSLFTDHATGFTLNGDTDNDSLLAVESFDITLNGGTGNDRLETADGLLSTLNGGDGNDVLVVSLAVGASTMNGGAGADTLQCDFGSDTICDYNAVSDSPVGAGRDKINGFNGDFHRIDLTTIDAIPGGADNAFTYIGSAAFTAAGQLRYNTTTGILSGSTDGDTAAEFEIQLVGAPGLTVGGADTDILL